MLMVDYVVYVCDIVLGCVLLVCLLMYGVGFNSLMVELLNGGSVVLLFFD